MSTGQNWFIQDGDKANGPFGSRELRELANQNKITPHTLVRLEEAGKWVAASKVKGLFKTTDSVQSRPAIVAANVAHRWPASMSPKAQIPPAPASTAETPTQIRLATARQKEYAQSLGIEFSDDITVETMSKLIQDAVDKRDEDYYEKLDEMEQRGSDAWKKMREEVLAEIDEQDCRLSKATPSQMVTELSEQRDLAAVLLTLPWDGIEDFGNLTGKSLNISFGDDMTLEDVEDLIMSCAGEIMKKRGLGDLSDELAKLNDSLEKLGKKTKGR